MKIKRKYLPLVTAVCMGFSMGIVMSFVMTLVNVGMGPRFFIKWMKAFIVGASVGIPLAVIVVPFLSKQLLKLAVD